MKQIQVVVSGQNSNPKLLHDIEMLHSKFLLGELKDGAPFDGS